MQWIVKAQSSTVSPYMDSSLPYKVKFTPYVETCRLYSIVFHAVKKIDLTLLLKAFRVWLSFKSQVDVLIKA